MDEYLSELKNKFGYSDDLLKAIEITIGLMIDEYGEDAKSDIYSLFAGTKVYALSKVNRDILNKIGDEMRQRNPHVIYDEAENPYGCDLVSSSYSFEPVFGADMKVVDEARCIITEDMTGRFNEGEYRRIFGTAINVPYIIHEANHAYAMMHPEYTYEAGKVTAKHGMYKYVYEYYLGDDGKYIVSSGSSEDIIIEEVINESITQRMLVKLLNKNDYSEVRQLLNSIRHTGTEYGITMVALGEAFVKAIGRDAIMDYRRNNNASPIAHFNEQGSKSDIALEYLGGVAPYKHLSDKLKELFDLNVNKLKYDVDDYAFESAKIMISAMAAIEAYKEVEYNKTNVTEFNKRSNEILSKYNSHNNSLN